jgi:hypothetical protein
MLDRSEDQVPGGDIGGDLQDVGGYDECLEGLTFPASREDVLVHLRGIGADDSLIAHVESLTGDEFESAADIFTGITPH